MNKQQGIEGKKNKTPLDIIYKGLKDQNFSYSASSWFDQY